MSTQPPAGWYADPAGSPQLRWWDGQAWTASMSNAAAAAPTAVGSGPIVTTPYAYHHVVGQQPSGGGAFTQPVSLPATGWNRNRYALITFGIVAAYLVIAMASRIVFIGILPLGMAIRSRRGGEPLAPLALGAAVVSIVIAFAVLSGH